MIVGRWPREVATAGCYGTASCLRRHKCRTLASVMHDSSLNETVGLGYPDDGGEDDWSTLKQTTKTAPRNAPSKRHSSCRRRFPGPCGTKPCSDRRELLPQKRAAIAFNISRRRDMLNAASTSSYKLKRRLTYPAGGICYISCWNTTLAHANGA